MRKILIAVLFSVLFSVLSFAQTGNWQPGNQQAVTGTATALPNVQTTAVCLKVVPGGTQTVFIGGSGVTTSNGFPLAVSSTSGDSTCFQINNLNRIYVIASTTGSTIAWFTVGGQ
jgi:hypothetical protein